MAHKINLISSTIWTFLIFACQLSCVEKDKVLTEHEYGKGFNETRRELKIPPIEEDWVNHDESDSNFFWTNKDVRLSKSSPHHLHKITKIRKGKISEEIDAYHNEFSDSLSYRLSISNRFGKSGGVINKKFGLIIYYSDKYPPTITLELVQSQVDSLMNRWGILKDTIYIYSQTQ